MKTKKNGTNYAMTDSVDLLHEHLWLSAIGWRKRLLSLHRHHALAGSNDLTVCSHGFYHHLSGRARKRRIDRLHHRCGRRFKEILELLGEDYKDSMIN